MVIDSMLAEVRPAASYFIERVKRKQATGIYPTEPVACFCGNPDGQPVVETDRYGFTHRMVMCQTCGILRANPRMTAEAYRQFYEHEYRQIYDDTTSDGNDEVNWDNSVQRGLTLKQFVQKYDCHPKVVLELGCNAGGWLKPFVDEGIECFGVDYGPDRIAYGQQRGMPIAQGSIDDLERYGKKADLLILSHVIEHAMDLEGMLARLRGLLSDNGLLTITCPSLFTWDFDILFQNAHTYQFTSATLAYLMECCGFEEVYLDERISSLWRKADERRSRKQIDHEEVYRIRRFLGGDRRLLPTIKTINKFPLADRKRNIKIALSTGAPDLRELRLSQCPEPRQAIIIGGGPSVDLHASDVQALREQGAVVYAIERMLPWCINHGFAPEYVVTMDASDDVIDAFSVKPHASTYLVATQCQPSVFEALRGRKVYLYNTPQKGISMADFWDDANRQFVTQVNAGGSVTICAMSLAMTLGARYLHVFGFDCHVTDGTYANGIAGVGDQKHTYEIKIDGVDKIYTTTSPYLSFAQQFFRLIGMAKKEHMLESVEVYGDSLVKPMAKPGTAVMLEHRRDSILLKTSSKG